MSKSQDLKTMLQKAAGREAAPAPTPQRQRVVKAKAPQEAKEVPAIKAKEPKNARRLVVFVSTAGYKELAMLGIEIDKSFQAMLQEAANDYLEKHRKNPIA